MGNAMRTKKTLPEEVVEEILLKLSVKSLLRCRCVCKSWYDFIKNPNFIKSHLIKNQNHNYIILVRRLNDSMKTLSFLDYESLRIIAPDLDVPVYSKCHLYVCGPCNGLICISDNLNKIVLCNPSLREFEEIPLPRFTHPNGYHVTSMSSFGLGFDSSRNNYQVVSFLCLSRNYDDYFSYVHKFEKIQCMIYDVGTKTWREIEHEQGLDMSCIKPQSSPSGVLFNGALHWIAMGKIISSGKLSKSILCFTLNTEIFRCITLPNTVLEECIDSGEEKRMSLTDFDNSLALFAFERWEDLEDKFVEIWVLKQDGVVESWIKQFVVGPFMYMEHPLLVRKNELLYSESCGVDADELERELVSRSLDSDYSYHVNDYANERRWVLRSSDTDYAYYCSIDYGDTYRVLVNQPSLVSIK